jgi:hypothetical protein
MIPCTFVCVCTAWLTVLLTASPVSAQQRINPDVVRQIDSALSLLGMHERDLAMPHDLLRRDNHRTVALDNLFRKPYSAINASENIADLLLQTSNSNLTPAMDFALASLDLGEYQRIFLDNMPEAEAVIAKLGIAKSRMASLNVASSIVLLRHAGLLIQATDAVAPSLRASTWPDARMRSLLDTLWRISRSSESASVWEAHREEQNAFNDAQKLYSGIHVSSVKTILRVGPSLHDDLLRISSELLNARDVLIDSVKTIVFDTPYGRIAVGGPGNDVYQGRFTMIIDVGGNDVYQLTEEPQVSGAVNSIRLIVDLEGDDTYSGGDYSLGAGVNGVGIVIDRSGNDSYQAGTYSLGSGLLGFGILHDLRGDDIYSGGTNSQGAGILGIGMLLDDDGNDLYRCHAQSQAFAGVGGIGLLCDRTGNDTYLASSPFVDVLRYDDHQITFSQGAALGSRPHASGGIAVLVDGSGSDTYISDIYGQGTGYWFGIGSLIDRGGDDKYVAHQYAQGSGVHFATGYLHDLRGNDTYTSFGVSQGCGHDIAYGFLFDEDGNDRYTCESLSLGSGNANAVSIFVDLQGNDSYLARDTTNTLGYSDYRRGYGMIGLFIDASGDDTYPSITGNMTSRTKTTYGMFLDYSDTLIAPSRPQQAAPYTSQVELPSTADSLFVLASASHLRFQNAVEPARKKLASLGLPALPLLERSLGTQLPRQRLTVETAAKLLFATHPDSTVAMLSRGLQSNDNAVVGTAATIITTTKSRDLSPLLVAMASQDDWRKRRLAAFTLGELRDTNSINRVANLLTDTVAYVRARAAFALGATDSMPLTRLAGPLNDSFQIVRYSAIEGINRGKRQSVKDLTQHLQMLSDENLFRSNVRLLINADTSKADVVLWKSWVKSLSFGRLDALRRIERLIPLPLQPALLPPKKKKVKKQRAAL